MTRPPPQGVQPVPQPSCATRSHSPKPI
jgi:hypothetical protein